MTLYSPPSPSSQVPPSQAGPEPDGLFTLVTRHIVVPAAIIAMVSSFLFYLLEIRSLYLESTQAFKQVGFCFAAATVLIARYGKAQSGGRGRDDASLSSQKSPFAHLGEVNEEQGCYTLVLGVVTLLFMLQRSSAVGLLPNILIVAAVWRFATSVTRALSLEGDLDAGPKPKRLYGLERLRLEQFEKKMQEERGPAWGARRRLRPLDPDGHGNPVAAVGRLAALALLGFAVGEPFLLRATPDVTERALTDVIVFLFSTALVLAAGSAAGTLRHTVRTGGRVSSRVLPARLGVAALLSAAVLAAALALPGVQFQGQGKPLPAQTGGTSGGAEGSSPGQDSSQDRPAGRDGQNSGGEGLGSRGRQQGMQQSEGEQSRQSNPAAQAGASLVQTLSALGKLLRLPFLLGLLVAVFFALRALRPFLPNWGGLFDRLRAWLGRFRRERGEPPPPPVDPFADWGALAALSPRDAILSVYHRFLILLEQAGHPRPERTTPYEYLQGLPHRFKPLAPAAAALTELYVHAAYGDGEPNDEDRSRALAALSGMRGTAPTSPARAEGM